MGKEIERKFLVRGESWRREASDRTEIRQGYLNLDPERTVRVRLAGGEGFLTVKGRPMGLVRSEFEYPLPAADAREMLSSLCLQPLIEKIRWRVMRGGVCWDIDEFSGENSGLVLAEVELDEEDARIEIPDWAGEEVSFDPRYANASLVHHPFSRW